MVRVVKYSNGSVPSPGDIHTTSKPPRGRRSSSISTASRNEDADDDAEGGSDEEQRTKSVIREKRNHDEREIRRKKLEALSASVRKPRRVLEERGDNPLLREIGRSGDDISTGSPKAKLRGTEERKGGIFSDLDEDEGDGESGDSDESDGMSGFIVDDDESLEEGDSEIEVTPPSPPPPPRSVRRLVRGRRNVVEEEEEREELGELEGTMRTLDITEKDIIKDEEDIKPSKREDRQREALTEPSRSTRKSVDIKEVASDVESEVEDQPTTPLLSETKDNAEPLNGEEADGADGARFTTPPPSPLRTSRGAQKDEEGKSARFSIPSPEKAYNGEDEESDFFTTPPQSPHIKPRDLQLLNNTTHHIPTTPHRPNMDHFCMDDFLVDDELGSCDEADDLIDKYSPTVAPKTSSKLSSRMEALKVQGKLVREEKKVFLAKREKIAWDFFYELDEKLAKGMITKLAKSTGGVKIHWSKTLKTTAGRAKVMRQEDNKRNINGSVTKTYLHHATIELADKVLDSKDRLLNTLAHEFCHLCVLMIDGVFDHAHGRNFKAWGAKCSKMFRDRKIEVTTRHGYAIDYKYIWACSSCSKEYKRQSKSIDLMHEVCGHCRSRLVQVKPVPKPASRYQLFVKHNMAKIRRENPGISQGDIMRLLGQKYQEAKTLGGGEAMIPGVVEPNIPYFHDGLPMEEEEDMTIEEAIRASMRASREKAKRPLVNLPVEDSFHDGLPMEEEDMTIEEAIRAGMRASREKAKCPLVNLPVEDSFDDSEDSVDIVQAIANPRPGFILPFIPRPRSQKEMQIIDLTDDDKEIIDLTDD